MDCPPVLFLIFNRPEVTQQVFLSLREAQPSQLFVAADGPRPGRPNEAVLCEATRRIIEQVDWPCEVKTLFRSENLGCRRAVSGAITWFLNEVEYGIILEDDCLPTLDFFNFCAELLVRYRDDERIGMISGNNWGWSLYDKSLSYSFSRHGHIWGWATWRRAWEKFDLELQPITTIEQNVVKANISTNRLFADIWWQEATVAMQKQSNGWAHFWGVTRYINNLLTIRPQVNLVSNIGFGQDATHTIGQADQHFVSTGKLHFPLVHPRLIVPDSVADKMLEDFKISLNRPPITISRLRKWVKLNGSRMLNNSQAKIKQL